MGPTVGTSLHGMEELFPQKNYREEFKRMATSCALNENVQFRPFGEVGNYREKKITYVLLKYMVGLPAGVTH
jgi:hypothetical protein